MAENATDYNGWANYETWNVALCLSNDEHLYRQVCMTASEYPKYADLVLYLLELCARADKSTPDGVHWNDTKLDHSELDELLEEMRRGE